VMRLAVADDYVWRASPRMLYAGSVMTHRVCVAVIVLGWAASASGGEPTRNVTPVLRPVDTHPTIAETIWASRRTQHARVPQRDDSPFRERPHTGRTLFASVDLGPALIAADGRSTTALALHGALGLRVTPDVVVGLRANVDIGDGDGAPAPVRELGALMGADAQLASRFWLGAGIGVQDHRYDDTVMSGAVMAARVRAAVDLTQGTATATYLSADAVFDIGANHDARLVTLGFGVRTP